MKWFQRYLIGTFLILSIVGCATFIGVNDTPAEKANMVLTLIRTASYNIAQSISIFNPQITLPEERTALDTALAKVTEGLVELTDVVDGIIKRNELEDDMTVDVVEVKAQIQKIEETASVQ